MDLYCHQLDKNVVILSAGYGGFSSKENVSIK